MSLPLSIKSSKRNQWNWIKGQEKSGGAGWWIHEGISDVLRGIFRKKYSNWILINLLNHEIFKSFISVSAALSWHERGHIKQLLYLSRNSKVKKLGALKKAGCDLFGDYLIGETNEKETFDLLGKGILPWLDDSTYFEGIADENCKSVKKALSNATTTVNKITKEILMELWKKGVKKKVRRCWLVDTWR